MSQRDLILNYVALLCVRLRINTDFVLPILRSKLHTIPENQLKILIKDLKDLAQKL